MLDSISYRNLPIMTAKETVRLFKPVTTMALSLSLVALAAGPAFAQMQTAP